MTTANQEQARPERRVSIRKWIGLGVRLAVVLIIVTAITSISHRLGHTTAATVGFLYLVAILAIATIWGLPEAVAASIAATLCFDYYFLPPVGTFNIEDPNDWVAIVAFLASSLTVTQLSARVKRQAKEATERQLELERLYALSRTILLAAADRSMAKQITGAILSVFNCAGAALYDQNTGEVYSAGLAEAKDLDVKLRMSATTPVMIEDRQMVIAPIQLGTESIGSLAIAGERPSAEALQSLLNLVAMGLQKAKAREAANQAEIARQGELLKSKLLDAFAHQFKTPLTTVKAATTCLLMSSSGRLDDQQRELATIADRGADRLTKLAKETILLARVEGGEFRLNKQLHHPTSLMNAALRDINPLAEEREIRLLSRDDLPPVFADENLVEMAIHQFIDNALKYSPPDTPITVSARTSEGTVIISVADLGPGISETEQTRIFEKFYRGTDIRQQIRGSGVGLAVAREIARAHGGDAWVTSHPGKGSQFSLSLPVGAEERIA